MAEKMSRDVMVIVGYPGRREGQTWNLAGVLYNGEWLDEYAKQALPTTRCSTSSATSRSAPGRW